MPQYSNRQFLHFEQPIKELYEQIDQTKRLAEKNQKVDYSSTIKQLEESILEKRKEITEHLSASQRVQLSRHPDRPYTMKYITKMCTNFIEMHGDRNVKDDKAMVGGFAQLDGETVMLIGQQKGINTKMRQLRNFGMANPEGYRKALRLMKMAEKFNKPIVTFIDTPGAFPGLEAEERGQGEAIARNLKEMFGLTVPVICIVIGEGASGGALGIAIGDRVLMLENSWYSVISPENCSTILWRTWDYKEQAAELLKLTAKDMHSLKLVDGIIKEPLGGAHTDVKWMAKEVKRVILEQTKELQKLTPQQRIEQRIDKFCSMGVVKE
jgi:acetyl-CoA carboxylase carboxyl transferase subunit alpha